MRPEKDCRSTKILAKLVAWLTVLSLTLVLLFVLYNNSCQGFLILAILIGVNFGILVAPNRGRARREILSEVKFASLCIITFLTTLLMMELLFPRIFPSEYSGIVDLSKRLENLSKPPLTDFDVVFENGSCKGLSTGDCVRVREGERPPWHEPGRIYEYYGYEPNEDFKYVNVVCWNRAGYFDNDYSHKKKEGVYRIVIIGDSYVEAIQVPLSKTFHKLIESALNEVSGRGRGLPVKFEVIALGNSGAGQRRNLNVLKREATLYDPDMILLVLSHNDFCDDDPTLDRDRTFIMGLTSPLIRGLIRHDFFLLAFSLKRYSEMKRNRTEISPELLQFSGHDMVRIETAWDRSLALVRAARDYCAGQGIEFTLIYTSSELEVKHALDPEGTIGALRKMGGPHRRMPWDLRRSARRVKRFCRENHIALISLREPFVLAQKRTGKFIFGDHYTFLGHEIAAQALITGLNPKVWGLPRPLSVHLGE